MKTKALVFIDGQDNYMDIELFMGLDIIGDKGGVIDRHDIFGKPPSFRDIKISTNTLNRSSGYKQTSLSRKITILSINYNFIINELREMVDNKKLNNLQKRFYKLRNKYGYRSVYVIKLKRKIWFQKLENEREADSILKYNFGYLYNLLPDRYKSINEDRMDFWFGYSILKSFLINAKGLAYLEQQHDLKRIELNNDSLMLLKALKEFMRFRENDVTFDDYLDNWVKKLIGGEDGDYTNEG